MDERTQESENFGRAYEIVEPAHEIVPRRSHFSFEDKKQEEVVSDEDFDDQEHMDFEEEDDDDFAGLDEIMHQDDHDLYEEEDFEADRVDWMSIVWEIDM